ncbi:hypothetical protein [Phycicoccus sp. Soil803]|uniref:hypothetical protein n=1 Tax=Phycicoccus sp. Soil803 TaxID=1736415 RepID=UPI0012F7F123|nr:hypothetical protein [Phycicoccus sp. Soil803]
MGVSDRDREGVEWGGFFAALFGGAIVVAVVAAMVWFVMIGPMVDAFRYTPPSSGQGHYDPPDPTPDLSDEYPDRYDDHDMPATWVCSYDPTMNNDWHDDVLCTDGVSRDRPYLLPDDSFVTDDELMREAARYEDYLNS